MIEPGRNRIAVAEADGDNRQPGDRRPGRPATRESPARNGRTPIPPR